MRPHHIDRSCATSSQGYWYVEILQRGFEGVYELISKLNVGLKTLLREGLSEPDLYGDLANKFKKLIGRNDLVQKKKSLHVTDV